jgi:hypothetical protein
MGESDVESPPSIGEEGSLYDGVFQEYQRLYRSKDQ